MLQVLLLMPLPAMAVGNLKIGRLQVHPELTYQLTYDSNIYKDPEDEQDDFIHIIRPGVRFLYEGNEDNKLEFGYNIGFIRFTDNSRNSFHEHNAFLDGMYKTPWGLYLRLNDTFAHTADPYGNSNSYREGETKVRRWYNNAGLSLGYELNRLSFEASYANHYERYLEDIDWWQNRNDHQFSLTAYYRFMPRTSALLQYRFVDINYTNQNNGDNSRGIDSDTSQDARQHQIFTGLRFDPTGKLKGEIKLGLGRKNYVNDRDWNGDEYEDVSSWLAEGSLVWDATAKTSLSTRFARSLNDSTESYATQFTTTTLSLGLRHQFFDQLAATSGVGLTLDDYNDVSPTLDARHDLTLMLDCGLEYTIQDWLMVGLGYAYADRSSSDDFQDEEYQDHRTTLSLYSVF